MRVLSPLVIELNTEEISLRGSPVVEVVGNNLLSKEETGSPVVCVAVLPVGLAVSCVAEMV